MHSVASIQALKGRRVLNSQGAFTLEVETVTPGGRGIGSVPLGITTSNFDSPRADLTTALAQLPHLSRRLIGLDACDQRAVDNVLREHAIERQDLTQPAANLACAVSLSVSDAAARIRNRPAWQNISEAFGATPKQPRLAVNVVSGGAHNLTGSPVTEALVVTRNVAVTESVVLLIRALNKLRELSLRHYGPQSLAAGVEGGFTPSITKTEELLELLTTVLDNDDELRPFGMGLDMAGNTLVGASPEGYSLGSGPPLTDLELAHRYSRWVQHWSRLLYLEDPFSDNDVKAWRTLSTLIAGSSERCHIVADDVLATQLCRLTSLPVTQLAASVIAKVDQNGTISGMADFIHAARERGLGVVVSQRSQETDQAMLVDLAVGLGADILKAGCVTRERIIKYNRLIRVVSREMVAS